MAGGMPSSPKGREIRTVEGNPSGVIDRGNKITELGEMMDTAAVTLREIKENSFAGEAQAGKAVESLQESIDDSYETLEEAADLYKPVGPVIVKYGEMLETNKPQIDGSATSCADLWNIYATLPGDMDESLAKEGDGSGEGDTTEQEAGENHAKKDAYDNWENEAERFDTWFDAWEEGFDEAVDGISDGLSGSIKDGFWEFLSKFLEVLEWIALALGVLAIIFAGPFAALALIVSAVALVGKFIQAAAGEGEWTDVIFAALAVIPVGNISRIGTAMTKGFKFGAARGAVGIGKWSGKVVGGASGFGKSFGRSFVQQFDFSAQFGFKTLKDIGVSSITGKTASEVSGVVPGAFRGGWEGFKNTKGKWEVFHGTAGQAFTYNNWGYMIAGEAGSDAENWKSEFPANVITAPWS